MKYDPKIHHRRSIQLKGYDYSQAGAYFITICCQNRICRFGKIEYGKMILNEYGMVAYNEWTELHERFSNFELDVFQIMPNHIHGIIVLNNLPLRCLTLLAYKSLVANACLEIYKSKNEMMGKLWQHDYHEYIIRNEQSYQTISDYIINKPVKWVDDKFYSI